MSISAEPLKAPRSEIWITRESMVASTRPSTTRVSQSLISTPLSLMFGPTISLLPISLEPELACGPDEVAEADEEDGEVLTVLDTLDTPGCVKLLLALNGEF